MGHAVQQGNRLVRINGDQDVASVCVDIIIYEPSVEKAQQRGLVKAVQLRRVLEAYNIQRKSTFEKIKNCNELLPISRSYLRE